MGVDRLDTPKRPLPYSHSRTHSHNLAYTLAAAADVRLPNNAAKGKYKETEDFRFGWWDLVPLLEPRRPPVQWTSSSLIVTAHAAEPRVTCLHFPSNKHFTLPDPPAIQSSPAAYDPPTIIAASSRDDWIFAYFPGIEVDGVGCFWNKSRLVDDWSVKEWRTFARGDSIVAARWLNPDREWSSSESGTPIRLPALGPFIPLLHPVLVIVTETHLCDVFYLHPRTEKVHMLSASLARRSTSKEGQERPVGERVDGPRGLGRCVHAAIGLGYDESSVLVSVYSSFVPSASPEKRSHSTTNMDLSLSMPSCEEPEVTSNWDTWKDENIIEICEVNISVDGFLLTLATTPLPSIRGFSQSGRCLTSMTFAPSLPSSNNQTTFPSTPTQTHRRVTPQSSPATVPAHVSHSPGRSVLRSPVKGAAAKPVLEKAKVKPPGALYLLCTTLDHGQFASAPSSEIILYVLWRNPSDPQTWYFRRASHLSLQSSVVVHVSPAQPINTTQCTSALLGVLNREGQVVKKKGEQRLNVGRLQILRLPELQIDDSFEPVNLICPVGSYGVELPFNFAASPNRALVCSIPGTGLTSFSANASASIYQHPVKLLQSGQESAWLRAQKQLATLTEIALWRRFALSDLIHIQSTGHTPISVIEEALATALLDFETGNAGMTSIWTNEIIGVAIEAYRKGSHSTLSGDETSDMASRYQTGLEICSLLACNSVWEDTFGPKGYDSEVVWNLTSLCGFFMEDFLEKLLKECVQFASEVSLMESFNGPRDASRSSADSTFSREGSSAVQSPFHLSSSLLHLVHPYALEAFHTFVQHVRRFRGFVGSSVRTDGHLQVAREILIDCVDSSPVDLESLDKVLSEIKMEVKENAERSPLLARRCLVALKPPAEFTPLLQKIVSKLMQAQVADKLALFIKPTDLVDSMIGPSARSPGKTHHRDVITKGYLTGQNQTIQCLRCGGKSEINIKLNNKQSHSSAQWSTWERNWHTHCVCGGMWSTKA